MTRTIRELESNHTVDEETWDVMNAFFNQVLRNLFDIIEIVDDDGIILVNNV